MGPPPPPARPPQPGAAFTSLFRPPHQKGPAGQPAVTGPRGRVLFPGDFPSHLPVSEGTTQTCREFLVSF